MVLVTDHACESATKEGDIRGHSPPWTLIASSIGCNPTQVSHCVEAFRHTHHP